MIPKFNDYLKEDKISGGVSNSDTPSDVAKHHGVSVKEIEDAIAKGTKVEMEHTDDTKIASEIAKDHVYEDPKYYDKLSKVEEASKEYEFDPGKAAERLKRREQENIQRYRAAQDRGDNFAIALYELKIKMDKIDLEALKVQTAIHDLKNKYGK
jgi:hypothetical protein